MNRHHLDWRFPTLLSAGVLATAALSSLAATVWANLVGRHLPYEWRLALLFLVFSVLLRIAAPALLIWIAAMKLSRCFGWPQPFAATLAGPFIAILGWLILVWTAREVFGPSVLHEKALLLFLSVLPIGVFAALLLTRLLYSKASSQKATP